MIHKKYRSLIMIAIQDSMAYRGAYFFTVLGRFVALVTLFYIWRGLFTGHDVLNGYTWEDMKTYLFITFTVNALISWYSEGRISSKIRDGSVAADLIKPLNFQKMQLAGTVGSSVGEIAVSLAFCIIILPLFGGIHAPVSAIHTGFFFISIIFSFLIKFGIVYLFGLMCFFTTESVGLRWARGAVTDLFSGALIPITFFPATMLSVSNFLPFRGIVYIPASIYTGTAGDIYDIIGLLAFQAVWAVVLWFCGMLLWNTAIRKVTVAGG